LRNSGFALTSESESIVASGNTIGRSSKDSADVAVSAVSAVSQAATNNNKQPKNKKK